LAQAIYIKSCVLGDKIPVWTDAEEMITIVGIAPLFVCDNKTYLLEDRQNEEVYNIREETMREDFSSNEDIRKFRYHYTFSYRELSKRINSDLVALSCEQLKPDADMGIDNMKFPEHLPFSSILLEHGESTFTDGEEILKYCEDTLKQYLRQLTPQRQREILDCLNERKYTNSYELLSHIVNEEVGIRGEKCQLSDRL
jgi:hypothetical protein